MRILNFLNNKKLGESIDPSHIPTQPSILEHNAESKTNVSDVNVQDFQQVPKILLIDFDETDISLLTSKGLNCTSGTLGTQVEVPKKSRNDEHICLLNYDLPPNLHEFNIILVNLQNVKTIPYDPKEHQHTYVKDKDTFAMRSRYPQTIFDPRPFCGAILASKLSDFITKSSLIIVFSDVKDDVSYDLVRISKNGIETTGESTYNTYSFLSSLRLPYSANVMGKETRVSTDIGADFYKLLDAHNKEAIYSITFQHTTEWNSQQSEQVKRSTFVPLMLTSDDRIIAYADFDPKTSIFVFPEIKRKGEFLVELFQTVLPNIFPDLFPYSTRFAWLKDKKYQLPNEELLSAEKFRFEEDYAKKIEELNKKSHDNYEEYSWLHDLLTKTGDSLVKTVERYFNFLEFTKITNVDEEEPTLKEEDLRVELEKGLLVVEVKGIGGTSTDSDCSQISKIRYRRGKQRKVYDVYGLYIVNHQLNLPPQDRAYPPFTKQQIQDAINDERGLLTTYELFKLFFYIKDGFVTKEAARASLLEYGLVTFTPSNSQLLGSPLEIHYGGTVAILKLENNIISKGIDLIVVEPHNFYRAHIIDIQINGESVNKATNCVVGIKLDSSVSKTSQIWILNS